MLRLKWIPRFVLSVLALAILAPMLFGGTFVGFGPVRYVRTSDKPAPETRTFSVLDPAASYSLRIDSSKISAAVITLNGVDIFTEKDFNANVTVLTKAVTLRATNQ